MLKLDDPVMVHDDTAFVQSILAQDAATLMLTAFEADVNELSSK